MADNTFRVWNRVLRVGIEWRIGGIRFQLPTMMLMLGAFVVTTGAVVGLIAIGGVVAFTLGGVAAVAGIAFGLWVTVFAGQMNNMGITRETTQVRLLYSSSQQPVYMNFHAPDSIGDAVVRNY